jgi:aryl-alcohol dehydrogenase-like predicted oxidoreductase
VAAALDAGVTMFDTADVYGDGLSEEFLGRALGTQRHNVVITSKFGYAQPPDGLSGGDPRWIPRACEASLRRLGTDHIDLYLLHRPDPVIPVADTLGAMSDLVDQGRVREIGCSNFSASQLSEAASTAEERQLRRFVALQNEYSLLQRTPEHGVLQRCSELEMAFIPYSPLANGLLTGKYRRGEPAPAGARLNRGGSIESVVGEDRLRLAERLSSFAQQRGHTLLELALSWLASRDGVASGIAGATSAEQVRTNIAAMTAWQLSGDELAEIDRITGAA